ncbi:MAG: FmdB family zinc ribbon protein, partial [Actinomycetes bacterium]
MPTYQYACTECGHDFEAVQSFSDDALTECPECTGRLRKVFSAVGVVFKGSGFYRTDSRGSGSGAASGSGATPAKDGGSTGSDGAKAPAAAGTSGTSSSGSGSSGSGSSGSGSSGSGSSGS